MLGAAYGESLSMNDGRIFAIIGEMRLEDCKPCKGMFILVCTLQELITYQIDSQRLTENKL